MGNVTTKAHPYPPPPPPPSVTTTYIDYAPAQPPAGFFEEENGRVPGRSLALIIILAVFVPIIIFAVGYVLLCRRRRRPAKYDNIIERMDGVRKYTGADSKDQGSTLWAGKQHKRPKTSWAELLLGRWSGGEEELPKHHPQSSITDPTPEEDPLYFQVVVRPNRSSSTGNKSSEASGAGLSSTAPGAGASSRQQSPSPAAPAPNPGSSLGPAQMAVAATAGAAVYSLVASGAAGSKKRGASLPGSNSGALQGALNSQDSTAASTDSTWSSQFPRHPPCRFADLAPCWSASFAVAHAAATASTEAAAPSAWGPPPPAAAAAALPEQTCQDSTCFEGGVPQTMRQVHSVARSSYASCSSSSSSWDEPGGAGAHSPRRRISQSSSSRGGPGPDAGSSYLAAGSSKPSAPSAAATGAAAAAAGSGARSEAAGLGPGGAVAVEDQGKASAAPVGRSQTAAGQEGAVFTANHPGGDLGPGTPVSVGSGSSSVAKVDSPFAAQSKKPFHQSSSRFVPRTWFFKPGSARPF